MLRSHGIALAGLAALLLSSTSSSAQTMLQGEQCTPAVANPEMYHNCQIRIVRGNEVCRCAIAPRSIRGLARQDQN